MLDNAQFLDFLSIGEILILLLIAFIIYLLSRIRSELPTRIRLRERQNEDYVRELARNADGQWIVSGRGNANNPTPAGPIKIIPGDTVTWSNTDAQAEIILQFPTNALLEDFQVSNQNNEYTALKRVKGDDGHVVVIPPGLSFRARVSKNITQREYVYAAFVFFRQGFEGDASKAFAIGGSPPRMIPDEI